jgi:hypothetical protein
MVTEKRAGAWAGVALGVGIAMGLGIGELSMYWSTSAPIASTGPTSSAVGMDAQADVAEESEVIEPAPSAPKPPDEFEVGLASLKNLNSQLYDLKSDSGQRDIDRARANLKCLRDWIGVAPERQPYLTWWSYFSDQADKAQDALAHGGPKTNDEEIAKQLAAEDARRKAIAKTLPVPPREATACARDGNAKAKAGARKIVHGEPATVEIPATVEKLPQCGDENRGETVTFESDTVGCRVGAGVSGAETWVTCRCGPDGWSLTGAYGTAQLRRGEE